MATGTWHGPLIREILREIELSPEQFRKELERADH
jgi:hypothetical protein